MSVRMVQTKLAAAGFLPGDQVDGQWGPRTAAAVDLVIALAGRARGTPPTVFGVRPVPAAALEIIRRFEGLHDGDKRTPNLLEPQADPIGIFTIGWGYALFENGRPVKDKAQALRIWRARWPAGFGRPEADALLREVAQEVCNHVLRLLPGAAPNDDQLGAMVSLAYNIGVGEIGGAPDFADSSVRRRYLAGDLAGAADAFLMWRFADGKALPGLERRRREERALFLSV